MQINNASGLHANAQLPRAITFRDVVRHKYPGADASALTLGQRQALVDRWNLVPAAEWPATWGEFLASVGASCHVASDDGQLILAGANVVKRGDTVD